MRIKVLQFGSSMGLFGAERWILALARYSDISQVENVIFTIKDAPTASIDLIKRAEEMGLQTDLIYAKGPFDPRTIFQTYKLIKKHKADILHTHGYKSDIIGYLAAELAGIPIISTPHGSELSKYLRLNIYQKIAAQFLKKMDRVVPVSEGLKNEYIDKGLTPSIIKVIKNGVDIMEVEETMPNQGFMSMKRDKNIMMIGYVGQLIERKGLPNLIKAIKTVNRTMKAKLFLIGEGNAGSELKDLVESEGLFNDVEFLGFRADRLEIMKCFDVFVLPSYIEGIPRVIMEAMAAKVPVIASDIPGIREIIHQNKTGILVPTDSPDQLAHTITELLNNHKKADEIKENAFDYVKANHSAKRMSQEYAKLYKEVLGNSKTL